MICALIISVCLLFFNSIESVPHDSVGCSKEEFPCRNGQCIFKPKWCDGVTDCNDFSDEIYCLKGINSDPNSCLRDQTLFLCKDGRCIPTSGVCDGVNTCEDKSDEKNCRITEESNVQNISQTALSFSNNYYSENYYNFEMSLIEARNWLLSQWDEDSGWGKDTARAVIALFLSNKDNDINNQTLLIKKQLDIQLFVALTRNSSEMIPLCDLSHYINALAASCENPRNFNGNDLVSALRARVDSLNNRKSFVSPYVYLTLCIHNLTRHEDIYNMQTIFHSKLSVVDKFDMMSLSVLFASCAIKQRNVYNPDFYSDMLSLLVDKVAALGLPKSVYELSLVVQALTEVKFNLTRWHRKEAVNFILDKQNENGSFGDFLATYYTIPILSGRSMLNIFTHCNRSFLQVYQDDSEHSKIQIFYSLYFGYPAEMIQTLEMNVTKGTSFQQIMNLAEEKNKYFRFKLDKIKDIEFVYSIGGVPNDAENGIYWTSYVNARLIKPDSFRYDRDLRYYYPQDKEEILFWLRPLKP